MRNYHVYIIVVTIVTSLSAMIAGYFELIRKPYRTIVQPELTSLGSSTVGLSTLTSTTVLVSVPSATVEAQKQIHGDETASWKICRSKKYGFEVKYPPNWMVWAPGPPEARPATCDEERAAIFLGPDIYSTLYPVQLNLYIYDEENESGTEYEGRKTLNDYLSSDAGKARRITKESLTVDGERLLWFDRNQLLSFHHGGFYEFRAHRVDDGLLAEIMSTFQFIQ